MNDKFSIRFWDVKTGVGSDGFDQFESRGFEIVSPLELGLWLFQKFKNWRYYVAKEWNEAPVKGCAVDDESRFFHAGRYL